MRIHIFTADFNIHYQRYPTLQSIGRFAGHRNRKRWRYRGLSGTWGRHLRGGSRLSLTGRFDHANLRRPFRTSRSRLHDLIPGQGGHLSPHVIHHRLRVLQQSTEGRFRLRYRSVEVRPGRGLLRQAGHDRGEPVRQAFDLCLQFCLLQFLQIDYRLEFFPLRLQVLQAINQLITKRLKR